MTSLQAFTEAIRSIQRSAPGVELHEITVSKKTLDRVAFEMMKQDRQTSNPTMAQAKRYAGQVKIMGVIISAGEAGK